jgi:hypothetical protein
MTIPDEVVERGVRALISVLEAAERGTRALITELERKYPGGTSTVRDPSGEPGRPVDPGGGGEAGGVEPAAPAESGEASRDDRGHDAA